MRALFVSILLFICCIAIAEAGTVTIPNSFTAGTTSSAAQVNANFTAIKTAVDDNATRVVPAGAMMPFAGATPPAGWLLCNGATLQRTGVYASLFAAIGTAWGTSGGTNFMVPDLRGRFLRGVDAGAGNDPNRGARTAQNVGGNAGDAVGSVQGDSFQGHWHGLYGTTITGNNHNYGLGSSSASANTWVVDNMLVKSPISDGVNGVPRTASETRPKNANVTYIIKY